MTNGNKKFKENDRVRRAGAPGSLLGTVKMIRHEIQSAAHERREPPVMVQVQWDNGTLSYFGPEGLDPAEQK